MDRQCYQAYMTIGIHLLSSFMGQVKSKGQISDTLVTLRTRIGKTTLNGASKFISHNQIL